MPLKEGDRRHIEEDVLSGLGMEPFAPHLNLNGLGGMLHHLCDDYGTETADEADDAFDDVDD